MKCEDYWQIVKTTALSANFFGSITVQKMKFSIKDFFSKCDKILNGKLHCFVQCMNCIISVENIALTHILQLHFYTPWKLSVFWRFQGIQKCNIGRIWVNPFHAIGPFLYPLKTSENQVFWYFQGGIERYQWYKWAKSFTLALLSRTKLNEEI